MLFKSYIPGNDTFVFILNLDISRPVLHSTFDIQMGKIDIDNMSSVYIYLPLSLCPGLSWLSVIIQMTRRQVTMIQPQLDFKTFSVNPRRARL